MIESAQIDRMSLAEKLQALEQIWEAVRRDDAAVSSPEWHGDVLQARKTRAGQGEAKFLTLSELRQRLGRPQS